MTRSKAYSTCLSTGLFFLFSFLQMSLPNSLGTAIQTGYHLSAFQYSAFLSAFFYGAAIMTLPAGLIIDRLPIRTTLLISCGISVFISLCLTQTHSSMLFIAGRFIQGAAHGFALLLAIKVITYCFPVNKIGKITGLIIALGMVSGMIAQAPLFLLYQHFGLHVTLICLAILGVSIWAIIAFNILSTPLDSQSQKSAMHSLHSHLITALRNQQNWLIALYITLLNLVLMTLGASWGQHLLIQHHPLQLQSAALITTLLFLGILVGSPIFGWLSDKLQTRRLLILISTIITIFMLILLILTNKYIVISGIIFTIGFCNGSQTLGFTHAVASNSPQHTSISTELISIIIMLGSAVILPLFSNTIFTLLALIGMMILALIVLILSQDTI